MTASSGNRLTDRKRIIHMLVALTAPMAVYGRILGFQCSHGGSIEPWIHHGANWILHGGNVLLLFLLVERLFDTRRALPAALIWGIHPLTAESVASCAGTMNLLIGAFVLVGAGLLARRVPPDASRRWSIGALAFIPLVVLGLSYVPVRGAVIGPGSMYTLDLYVPGLFFAALATSWVPVRDRSASWGEWVPWAMRLGAVAFFHLLGFLTVAQAQVWSAGG